MPDLWGVARGRTWGSESGEGRAMMTENPIVYLLSRNKAATPLLAKRVTWGVEWKVFESPLELIAAVARKPPLFAVVHLGFEVETWIPALEILVEQPGAPRLLLLTEPAVLEDTMHGIYRDGVDELLLWPAETDDLDRMLFGMFRTAGGDSLTYGLRPGLHDQAN